MTTTDPAAEAAVQVPSPEPAPGTETPGAAEPDAAAPGTGQDGSEAEHEPALDEAEPYDFAAHGRRVLGEPWPHPEMPVIFTDAARAAIDAFDASVARAVEAAIAENARVHLGVVAEEGQRLQDWLNLRARRFPAHAA